MEAPEIIEKLKAAEAVQEALTNLLNVNADLMKGYRQQLRYEIESKISEWAIHDGINILDFGIYGIVVEKKNGVITKINISKPKVLP